MTLKQLEYFSAFASCLNCTAAAKRCFTTQPNLSRQLSRLEMELDTKLFVRDGGKYELTATGKLLAEKVARLMAVYEEIQEELKSSSRPVISFGYTTKHYLMDALRAYVGQEFCGYHIQWSHGTGDILLDAGVLDMCFTFSTPSEHYIKLDDAIVYAIIPRVLMPECPMLQISELEKYPVLLPPGNLFDLCTAFFKEHNLHPNVRQYPSAVFDKSIYLEQLIETNSIGFVPIDDYRMFEQYCFIAKVEGFQKTLPIGIQWSARKDRICRKIAQKILLQSKKVVKDLPIQLV